jgi:hypothetical protein
VGQLIFGTDGALYGVTEGNQYTNSGAAFKLTPPARDGAAWTETVLHNFGCQWWGPPDCWDAEFPSGGLIAGADGVFYGTTISYVKPNGDIGGGTVFMLTPHPYPGHWF